MPPDLARAAGLTLRAGRWYVTATILQGGEAKGAHTREHLIAVRPFPPGIVPAVVIRRYRTAVQIFPNEWASVEAGMEMPCYPEEHAAVGEQVSDFLAKQIAAEREALEAHAVMPRASSY